jgi:TatD DNase family protein
MYQFIDIHTHHPRHDVISPRMAGVHPWDAERGYEMPNFEECDIVGEIGLDYCCKADRNMQRELFERQLQIASTIDKPVVIHNVRATEDILKILTRYPQLRGVLFHGFIGSQQQAETIVKRGYYLSFGDRSLRSSKGRNVIATTDIRRLFCETDDDPNLAIEEIYAEVAKIRNMTTEELLNAIETNYKTFFRNIDY